MKEALSQAGIPFVEKNINSSMLILKQFLKLRDTREEFVPIKEGNRVGVPCIVVNKGEQILFVLPEDLGNWA